MEARKLYDADDEREWDEHTANFVNEEALARETQNAFPGVSTVPFRSLLRMNPNSQAAQKPEESTSANTGDNQGKLTHSVVPTPKVRMSRQQPRQRRRPGVPRPPRGNSSRVATRANFALQGDRFGVTPLHIAVERRSLDLVKLLVRSGADVDAQDNTGRSPLHLACEMERMDLVQALLGVRLQTRNTGNTPRGLHRIQFGRIYTRSTHRRSRPRMQRITDNCSESPSSTTITSHTSGSAHS